MVVVLKTKDSVLNHAVNVMNLSAWALLQSRIVLMNFSTSLG